MRIYMNADQHSEDHSRSPYSMNGNKVRFYRAKQVPRYADTHTHVSHLMIENYLYVANASDIYTYVCDKYCTAKATVWIALIAFSS